MEDTCYMNVNGYILPKIVRRYYVCCGLLTSVGLLFFTLFLFNVGSTQNSSKLPCFSVAILFAVLYIIFTVVWTTNYRYMRAKFHIDGITATNKAGSLEVYIPLKESTPTVLPYTFNFGHASLIEEYVVLTCGIVVPVKQDNIYKLMKNAWKSGFVILPKSNIQHLRGHLRGQGDGSLVP